MIPPLVRRWALFCITAGCTVLTLYHLARLDEPEHDVSPIDLSPDSLTYDRPLGPFRWKDVPQRHPVTSYIPLPSGQPVPIPKIQHQFGGETFLQKRTRTKRLEAVRKTFLRTWNGYKKHAWLQDELAPVSGGYNNGFGGWGATLVDTLDTLWIMGLENDFAVAVTALKKIDFTNTGLDKVNVFETTIRYLGGLLAAYDLSQGKYPILLEKAIELGDMLYTAFDTPNRMPITHWDWQRGARNSPQEASSHTLLAEIGSLTLEFTRLSQLTNDPKYYDAVQRISDQFEETQNATKIPGLWPVVVNARKQYFTTDRTFTLGAMADSTYEYFPKEHMMLGGLVDQYRKMYEIAIEAAKKYLFFRPLNPGNQDILISGTVKKYAVGDPDLLPEGQHLTCFTGGMVGIAAKIFNRPQDLEVARRLVNGCIWAYESMPTGIMPEIFRVVPCEDPDDCVWSKERWYNGVASHRGYSKDDARLEKWIRDRKLAPGFTEIKDGRYILRPEAIESVFILYRITGDARLQDKAWAMFEAVTKHTATPIAHAAIQDVTDPQPERIDSCESFWMAETLKYFYLIFSEPDLISLDDYVFNTEAHPLRRPH